jgi:hypothetical protein
MAGEGLQVEVKEKLAALIGGDAFPQAVYSGTLGSGGPIHRDTHYG